MTPRYVIHIGPMKTASTYLQESLAASGEDLRREGVCYPAELLDAKHGVLHLPVYYALVRRQAETLRPIFAKLNAEGHRIVLLSCEHLAFLPPDAFRTLKEETGASEFEIVYTCRRWSDRIGSLWNHSLFSGSAQSFHEFYFSVLAAEPLIYYPKRLKVASASPDLDYSLTWDMLASVFGRDSLSIFPYSAIMDRKEDVFERFCTDVLGLAQAPPTKFAGLRRWASMTTITRELVRVLNDMHFNATADRSSMFTPLGRIRKQCDLIRLKQAIGEATAKVVVQDSMAQFATAFERMSRYSDRVIGGGPLFEFSEKPVEYAQPGYMLNDGIREDYQAIYRKITDQLAVEA